MPRKLIDLSGRRFGKLTVTKMLRRSDCGKNGTKKATLWECLCDCGNTTTGQTNNLLANNKQSCGCIPRLGGSGSDNIKWNGGRTITSGGYILVRVYDYPGDTKSRSIHEHVYVMAKHMGRPLLKGECVHHKNGNRQDNRLENLELWSRQQPYGQRVEDKIDYAIEILRLYRPELLKT
jgi:hypothetical protein